MKLLFAPLAAAVLFVTGCSAVDSAVEFGQGAIDAGQQAVEAGQQALDTGREVIDSGRELVDSGGDLVDRGQDIVGAVDDLQVACDLLREASDPATPVDETVSLMQQAMAIVGGVVAAYPDTPGVSDLAAGLLAARQALEIDPEGAALALDRATVESTCSQLPSLP